MKLEYEPYNIYMKKLYLFLIPLMVLFCFKINAQDLDKQLAGKILLQVESMGQAWYVNPNDGLRHYLGRPADAFQVMRELGLGITEADFNSFKDQVPRRLAGRILLRVQANGEAYYVHPSLLTLHYLGRPDDALRIMRELGLGITNSDLIKIPVVDSDTAATSEDLAGTRAYVVNNILGEDSSVNIESIIKEGDFYRVTLKLSSGQPLIFYLAKDSGEYKPAVINMEIFKDKINSEPEVSVELFVMSHCPYGLQMEKGIIPAIETLGSKINFELKFVDYAMHGKAELDEQLRQYCIQKNEPEKLISYLNCFVYTGNSTGCLTSSSIDEVNINSCISETDSHYQVTEKYNNTNTWLNGVYPVFEVDKESVLEYAVKGSPTLVINGESVYSLRSPSVLLEKICSYFSTKPVECLTVLSSEVPAPGFGLGSGISSGSCGG